MTGQKKPWEKGELRIRLKGGIPPKRQPDPNPKQRDAERKGKPKK